MNDLYSHVLRYYFHPQSVAWAGKMGEQQGVRYLASEARQGHAGYYGETGCCKIDHDGHIKAWPGRDVGLPAVDVTIERAARDAWRRAHATAVQEALL